MTTLLIIIFLLWFIGQISVESAVEMCKKNGRMTINSPWWVYMLECRDGSLYTGITTNLSRRLAQHNGELAGGAKYTQARRPVALVYEEPCADRSQAGQREYQLRKKTKPQKWQIIADYRAQGSTQ